MSSRVWKVGAVAGWALVALQFSAGVRMAREYNAKLEGQSLLREKTGRCDYLPHAGREDWGITCANMGTALIRDGFEDQAPHLFAASGELLVDTLHAGQ